uniref:Nidogen n=1 Tax=Meloidogyne javanica TaxID=6303 RepID=A0A915MWM5_MELJA
MLAEGDELLQFIEKPAITRKLLPGPPFTFFERKQNLIFISANGAVSFGESFDTKSEDLSEQHKDIIAVLFAPSSNGKLALATDSNETYAIFVYSTINWTKSGGRVAQTGFFSVDGKNDKVLDQSSSSVGEVAKVTNFNEPGVFIYRISGVEPTDPRRPEGDDYEYQQETQEYDPDDQIVECPPDPYRDKCPPTCKLVMDDQHCVLSSSSENLAGSPYSTLTNDLGQELPLQNIHQQPKTSIQRSPDLSCAPLTSSSQCHAHAYCSQFRSGYCCQCEQGYIGNGAECLPQQEALRINGVFQGAINGKNVQKTELFSYIQPADGQQHTALAKINSEIGWSLLLVDSLSTPFGWLFAKSSASTQSNKNGFELTGGNFTRIVNMHLGDRYALSIRQEFTDRQFDDQFHVNVLLSGMLRSYSERYILLRGVGSEEQKFRVTVDQQIHFTECPYKEPRGPDSFTVKFERVNAIYDQTENIVRFASQSSIFNDGEKKFEREPIIETSVGHAQDNSGGTQDACTSGRNSCNLPNMVCVQISYNPGYRCDCRPGFRLFEDDSVEQRMVCRLVDKLENIVLPAPSTGPPATLQLGECTGHDQCHRWGSECVFGLIPGYPGKCKCRGWYIGDGITHCGPPGEICHNSDECGDNAKCEYSIKHEHYICFCSDGYYKVGEGKKEEHVLQTHDNTPSGIVPKTRKQCSDATDCHVFGSCLLSEQTNTHYCFCLPGFQGDGVEKCESSEECSPTNIQACPHPNQECVFEHSLRKFACQCKNGFIKQADGKCLFEPTEPPPSSVDRCKQCGANSQCVKQLVGGGKEEFIWNCICNPGFTGNGFECREENCLDRPQMCSPNAQCLPDGQKASYLCVSKILQTKETPDKLLIGRGMAIIQRSSIPNLDESGRQPHQTVVDIDYDCISGIAIDWRSQNIYYVDSIKNELGVLSINGKFQKTLLKEGLNNPRALVIDMESRQLFYSDWSRDAPKIGRIGLDGSGNKVIISDEIHLPNGLVMLQTSRRLCWADAGNQKLTCSALDGSNRKMIYAPLEYPFGLTADSLEERFYWTDWKDQKIHSIDITGRGYTEFYPGAGGRGKLYGILSLPVKCHFNTAPSECIQKEHKCTHWCLPGAYVGAFTCVCPDNVKGLKGC